MFSPDDLARASDIIAAARDRGVMLATAESCTGGLLAALLTEVAGSSAAVDRGFVTYSNDAKTALLGVPLVTINRYGAVSSQTAQAMARGALAQSQADCAVAVTGIAGPGGGSAEKPIGLVHFGLATATGIEHVERRFGDIGRSAVRLAAVRQALTMFEQAISGLGAAHPVP